MFRAAPTLKFTFLSAAALVLAFVCATAAADCTPMVEIALCRNSSAALLSDNSAMPSPASTRRFCAVRLSTGVQSISPSPWV